MSERFIGRVAIVTGAAQGISKAIAERLSREGANVIVADLQEQRANEVAAALSRNGSRAIAYIGDVAVETEMVQQLLKQAAGASRPASADRWFGSGQQPDMVQFIEAVKSLIPMGRLAKMEEVAATVAFLASEEASFIPGQVIGVNGGANML